MIGFGDHKLFSRKQLGLYIQIGPQPPLMAREVMTAMQMALQQIAIFVLNPHWLSAAQRERKPCL